ncbi:MAG: hypothetical protein WCA45_05570 [Thiobacillaceae bacterium]
MDTSVRTFQPGTPLSADELNLIHRYWQACNEHRIDLPEVDGWIWPYSEKA